MIREMVLLRKIVLEEIHLENLKKSSKFNLREANFSQIWVRFYGFWPRLIIMTRHLDHLKLIFKIIFREKNFIALVTSLNKFIFHYFNYSSLISLLSKIPLYGSSLWEIRVFFFGNFLMGETLLCWIKSLVISILSMI